MISNYYPWWKNIAIIAVLFICFIYAMPNLFGSHPAIQISAANVAEPIDTATLNKVQQALTTAKVPYLKLSQEGHSIMLLLASTDTQLKAKEVIQVALGDHYVVAINLASTTPNWLRAIGAMPMRLGLDLQGGVHLLLEVDVDSVLKQRIEGDLRGIGQALRDAHIRYSGINRNSPTSLILQFREPQALQRALSFVSQRFTEFVWSKDNLNALQMVGQLSPAVLQQARQDTLEQAMNTLRNRVNELGVSEAIVQQQGSNRVAVDLPGVQDTAQAKDILGKTATLEFHLVDNNHDINNAIQGVTPFGSQVYLETNGHPVLLKNEVILRGSSITSARSGFGEDGRPSVEVRLGGGGESVFTRTTSENIGKLMAVVYVEVKPLTQLINGKPVITYKTEKRVISIATILNTLGNAFQITGLESQDESRTLALLLRAGALPAPVAIIEERQVGPSLGKQNIKMGVLSIEVGFILVVLFMIIYYRGMGFLADIALTLNLVLIVAALSLLGATLTLPGMAGIVLTLGMAVDANVLIFERIREELRNGSGVQTSIYAGYERAFMTIVDANITILIVAVVLFSLGSGAVKGFAVTLTIGIMTSMFTAIAVTRAIVNWVYGRRPVKWISIGL